MPISVPHVSAVAVARAPKYAVHQIGDGKRAFASTIAPGIPPLARTWARSLVDAFSKTALKSFFLSAPSLDRRLDAKKKTRRAKTHGSPPNPKITVPKTSAPTEPLTVRNRTLYERVATKAASMRPIQNPETFSNWLSNFRR